MSPTHILEPACGARVRRSSPSRAWSTQPERQTRSPSKSIKTAKNEGPGDSCRAKRSGRLMHRLLPQDRTTRRRLHPELEGLESRELLSTFPDPAVITNSINL